MIPKIQQKKINTVHIPTIGKIPLTEGTVPVSGATVSLEQLKKAFSEAAKKNIFPHPEAFISS